MNRKTTRDYDPELLKLYDQYAHGLIGRRFFLKEATKYAAAGVTAVAILESLSPNYAYAKQVPAEDERIVAGYFDYDSPEGHGRMRGYLARPSDADGPLPGVIVVHENRGLNPYVEDVTRRLAIAGYVAFAPDALSPLGGYPGSDDEGREMQAKLDRAKIVEDFVAGAHYLAAQPFCDGALGVVGFCFGGWMSNRLAVRLPDLIKAAVPFYGGQPPAEDVPSIKASLLLHYAEHDERVNAGWPAYEAELKKNGIEYEVHFYEGASHGFHNDTTPRFDEEAARLAWSRTIAFFDAHLKQE